MNIILNISESERILIIALIRNAKEFNQTPEELTKMNHILYELGDEGK